MSHELLPDTWNNRDFPVLLEAARHIDTAHAGVTFISIAETTGLPPEEVLAAARALEADGLVELHLVMPSTHGRVIRISGTARRLVGQWPTPEASLDRIIAALEAIASNTNDEDTRSNARRFADFLRTSATTVGLGVATAAITGQLPGQ
jgi:predicted ArsR family transcriptional regulator